ncbi:MAG: hypothetical protein KDJ38_16695 [Gammaproteobacteria bacterium]|nr:hypothetical protein [Gammaproteobacteria bacterium]
MLDSNDIRELIRSVLVEELGRLGPGSGANADTAPVKQIREEHVSINSDQDLMDFALRILELSRDGKAVQELRDGDWVFRLDRTSAPRPVSPASRPAGASSERTRFERGLISERQISALASGSTLQVGKSVRFTPLALDEIRRRKIHLER